MKARPVRVLVVEDEASHAEAVRRSLLEADLPMEVHVAGSLAEFRDAVAAHPPDLVLLDLLLPDGRAESILVTPPENAAFPMVVMTSHGDEKVAVSTLQRGALDYVVKSPETFASMPATVERTLRAWSSLQEGKRIEDALRASEARFRGTLDNLMEGCQIVGFDWSYLYANPASARQGRTQVEALLGRTMMEVNPGITKTPFFKRLHECMEARKPLEMENQFEYADGSKGFFHLLIQPVQEGLFILSVDITDRKRAEAALAAELTRRRVLIDGSRDGIVVLNQQGGVFEANHRFAESLGYTAAETRRLHAWDWNRNWPREQVLAAIRDLGPEGALFETRHWRKDGSSFEVELSNSAAELDGQRLVFCVCHDITNRKKAEAAIRASEQRFRQMFEEHEAIMLLIDPASGGIVDANPAASAFYGYEREQLCAMRIDEINRLPPGEVKAECTRAQERQKKAFIFPHRLAHGEIRTVEVHSSPVDVEGRQLLFSIIQDITDRKKAEERAKIEAVRIRFLLDLHQQAPRMTDRELYDHVLEHAVRLTGSKIGFFHQVSEDQNSIILTTWNQEALKSCTATYDTHYPLREAGNWVDCVRERRPVIYNDYVRSPHRHGLPEGHSAIDRFMSIPVITDDKVRIIFGVGNKATDYDADDVKQLEVVANELHKLMSQREARSRQQHSEERFRQLVETTSDLIWESDATGRYTYVSPKIADILGYPPEDMLGHRPFEFMPPEEGVRVEAVFLDRASRREPFANSGSMVLHKDGRRVFLETSGAPVLDNKGQLTGYRGVDRDITGRKRLEEQLWQAQKLEAVGLLAGGVAHDFNNILSSIMMQVGLLEMNPGLDAEGAQLVKDLDAEARRAAALTRQLLMFSRRSVMEAKKVDLNELVRNLLKMLGRLIGEQIRLTLDVAPGCLPPVLADAGMLEQVIMNIVVNARDAMPQGGRVTITTSTEAFDDTASVHNPDRRAGRFVCMAISDTGIGMDEKTLRHLYEPFFTTKEQGKGTGLGLATVHGIVAQHKGWVEVESELGKGTTFRVYLPALPAELLPPVAKQREAPLQRGKGTILLVEDEPGLRSTVALTLKSLGYSVCEASSGQQAIGIWQQHGGRIDLLLTDMVMPEGMTGLELSEHLQALKPDLKIIISSGYSKEIVRTGGITQTGIRYLPKPYTTRTLADTIRNALDGR